MKKKAVVLAVIFFMAVLAGCGQGNGDQIQYPVIEEIPTEQSDAEESGTGQSGTEESLQGEQQNEPKQENQEAETDQKDIEFGFANLSDWLFMFSSGAGAWSTELSINSDGSFQGLYNDSNMGESGEGYPDGTRYSCSFKGKFDNLEKVDEFTFKMKLISLTFAKEPGTEELADHVRYVYSTAYGLDSGEEFYLYLPGAELAKLPEEYRRWVGYYDLETVAETKLPFYGLYNINMENGFSSYVYEKQSLSERIAEMISYAEERDAELTAKLQEDVTQLDMNETSAELLQNWDDTLNNVWRLLESELDETKMESLRVEEREWIIQKEEQVKTAGQGCEGGSMQSMIESMKAAELTKERVYELEEYAD